MSTKNNIPDDITIDQIITGLAKFVTMVEEEIQIHHSHPEWMDLDQRCNDEKNLIVRAGLILSMLGEALKQFKLPEDNETVKRIKAAQNYFNKID